MKWAIWIGLGLAFLCPRAHAHSCFSRVSVFSTFSPTGMRARQGSKAAVGSCRASPKMLHSAMGEEGSMGHDANSTVQKKAGVEIGVVGRSVVSSFLAMALLTSPFLSQVDAAMRAEDTNTYSRLEDLLRTREKGESVKVPKVSAAHMVTAERLAVTRSSSERPKDGPNLKQIGITIRPGPRQSSDKGDVARTSRRHPAKPEIPPGRITIAQLVSRMNLIPSMPDLAPRRLQGKIKPVVPPANDLNALTERATSNLRGSRVDAVGGKEAGQQLVARVKKISAPISEAESLPKGEVQAEEPIPSKPTEVSGREMAIAALKAELSMPKSAGSSAASGPTRPAESLPRVSPTVSIQVQDFQEAMRTRVRPFSSDPTPTGGPSSLSLVKRKAKQRSEVDLKEELRKEVAKAVRGTPASEVRERAPEKARSYVDSRVGDGGRAGAESALTAGDQRPFLPGVDFSDAIKGPARTDIQGQATTKRLQPKPQKLSTNVNRAVPAVNGGSSELQDAMERMSGRLSELTSQATARVGGYAKEAAVQVSSVKEKLSKENVQAATEQLRAEVRRLSSTSMNQAATAAKEGGLKLQGATERMTRRASELSSQTVARVKGSAREAAGQVSVFQRKLSTFSTQSHAATERWQAEAQRLSTGMSQVVTMAKEGGSRLLGSAARLSGRLSTLTSQGVVKVKGSAEEIAGRLPAAQAKLSALSSQVYDAPEVSAVFNPLSSPATTLCKIVLAHAKLPPFYTPGMLRPGASKYCADQPTPAGHGETHSNKSFECLRWQDALTFVCSLVATLCRAPLWPQTSSFIVLTPVF
ncbi:unnamed protein product [Discosporangium mesarthrocarpum]